MQIERREKKRSIAVQLMVAALLFALIPMSMSVLLFQNIKKVIVDNYSISVEQSVEAVAENINYTLRDIEDLSNSLMINHELMDAMKNKNLQAYAQGLNSYYISSFTVDGIYTITDCGYTSAGAELIGGASIFPVDVLANTSGETIWFPTMEQRVKILSGSVSKDYFSMGRKIIDVNSLKELGYILIRVDQWVIQEVCSGLNEEGSDIIVCDANGDIITHSNGDYTPLSERFIDNKSSKTILGNSNTGSLEYKVDEKEYVAVYSSCNNDKWRIIKTIPKDLLYRQINSIQANVYRIGSIVLGVMAIIAFIYSRKITNPIIRMMEQMKKVEQGNLDVRVDIEVHNELDDLGDSFNQMVSRLNDLVEEVVTVEKQKNEMELEVLHAQINPHFLYNTLNTIRWMAKIKGEDSISSAVLALVKLLRVSISLGKSMITIEEEIEYVQNYLLIQKLRFNQTFTMEYSIDDELKEVNIPKLILQPIVENALIHGIDEVSEEDRDVLDIRIFTVDKGDSFELIIEDNGPGMDSHTIENIFRGEKDINKFSTVGLNNVNQRIKMYFGEAYGLDILSTVGIGTKVIICLPKHSADEVVEAIEVVETIDV